MIRTINTVNNKNNKYNKHSANNTLTTTDLPDEGGASLQAGEPSGAAPHPLPVHVHGSPDGAEGRGGVLPRDTALGGPLPGQPVDPHQWALRAGHSGATLAQPGRDWHHQREGAPAVA